MVFKIVSVPRTHTKVNMTGVRNFENLPEAARQVRDISPTSLYPATDDYHHYAS